jgi:hypothetical protein
MIRTVTRRVLQLVLSILLLGAASVEAQDGYYFRDDFEDGNIGDGKPAIWRQAGGGSLRVQNGDLYIDNCVAGGNCGLGLWAKGDWARYTDVSYRLQGRVLEGIASIAFWGRSLDPRVYYGFVNTLGEQGIGDTLNGVNNRVVLPFDVDVAVDDVVMKLDLIGDEISMSAWRAGDAQIDLPVASFRDSTLRVGTVGPTLDPHQGRASAVLRWMEVAEIVPGDVDTNDVIDVRDIDYLAAAIREGRNNNRYDVNRDRAVGAADHRSWVKEIANTYFGDANLDRAFDSSDLIETFESRKYEDDLPGNASWSEGDWDGDGDFTTGDLVLAFQDGGYERGPRAALASVPEPSTLAMLSIGMIAVMRRAGSRTRQEFGG